MHQKDESIKQEICESMWKGLLPKVVIGVALLEGCHQIFHSESSTRKEPSSALVGGPIEGVDHLTVPSKFVGREATKKLATELITGLTDFKGRLPNGLVGIDERQLTAADIAPKIRELAPKLLELASHFEAKTLTSDSNRALYQQLTEQLRELVHFHEVTRPGHLYECCASASRIDSGQVIAALEQYLLYEGDVTYQSGSSRFPSLHPKSETSLSELIPQAILQIAESQKLVEKGRDWNSLHNGIHGDSSMGQKLDLTLSYLQKCLNLHGTLNQEHQDLCRTLYIKIQGILDHQYQFGKYSCDWREEGGSAWRELEEIRRDLVFFNKVVWMKGNTSSL